ncbi:hypothetical protein MTP03_28100 [Tsukamurella sp. PLM1]|nr:hypothetical protein MTP03_28100 [Tsukamurella sp. PLM1]
MRVVGVSGLVSHDDWATLVPATRDENREVRIAAAVGLATVGRGGVDAVRSLTADHDPLVRAAALEAFGALGDATDVELLSAGLADPAWQVRQGAARGTVALGPDGAVAVLGPALRDPHLDVRKAAVVALRTWPSVPAVAAALESALDDSDADVRARAACPRGEVNANCASQPGSRGQRRGRSAGAVGRPRSARLSRSRGRL